MICGDCGETNKPGTEFCLFCGAYLGWQEQENPTGANDVTQELPVQPPPTALASAHPPTARATQAAPPVAPVPAQPERPLPLPRRASPAPSRSRPSLGRPLLPARWPRRRRHPHPAGAPHVAVRSIRGDVSAGTVVSSSSGRAPVLRSPGRRSGAPGGPDCGTARTGSPDGRTGAAFRRCTAGAG